MASQADPRLARLGAEVRNAPDPQTIRTSETLLFEATLAHLQKLESAQAEEMALFECLQARYG